MPAPMIGRRTRADIEVEIRDLRAEANRLPSRHNRRTKIEARIDSLVDDWINAED